MTTTTGDSLIGNITTGNPLIGNITTGDSLSGNITTLKLEEIVTNNFQFIDRGQPGLSAGDVLTFETKLIAPDTEEVVATKNAIERYIQGSNGDIISIIQETIEFEDGSKLYTLGTFNQTQRPDTLNFGIVNGTGTFNGAKGFEEITSVLPFIPGDDQVDSLINLTFIS